MVVVNRRRGAIAARQVCDGQAVPDDPDPAGNGTACFGAATCTARPHPPNATLTWVLPLPCWQLTSSGRPVAAMYTVSVAPAGRPTLAAARPRTPITDWPSTVVAPVLVSGPTGMASTRTEPVVTPALTCW